MQKILLMFSIILLFFTTSCTSEPITYIQTTKTIENIEYTCTVYSEVLDIRLCDTTLYFTDGTSKTLNYYENKYQINDEYVFYIKKEEIGDEQND